MYLAFIIDLGRIFQEVVTFAGTFNPWLVLAIFVILTIGEFSISVPYLLETVWILTGYHVVTGVISAQELITLMLLAMVGRACGVILLYCLVRYGNKAVTGLYKRFFPKAQPKITLKFDPGTKLNKILSRINTLSSISVAMGRLFYLRIPLTVGMALREKLRVLLMAVVISSIIWDTIYILIGVLGGTAKVSQLRLLLYSLAGIALIYGVRFIVQRLSRAYELRRNRLATGTKAAMVHSNSL